jgi:apolipoprotein N-acyltransferase
LQQVRVRAIEEGLPVVRAANTGISAIIDPYGRILQRLDLSRSGVIDGSLPLALEPTYFSKWGNNIFFLMILALLFIRITWAWRQNRSK